MEILKNMALLKKTIVTFFLKVIVIIVNYVFVILITKNFGAETWGIITINIIYLQILAILGKFGMDMVFLRLVSEFNLSKNISSIKELYKKISIFSLSLTILITVVCYKYSFIIANFLLNKPYFNKYLKITIFGLIPLVFLSFHSEIMRALGKIYQYVFFQQIAVLLLLTFIITIFLSFLPNVGYYLLPDMILKIYVECIFLISLFSLYIILKVSRIKGPLFKEKVKVTYKNIFSYALPFFISSSLSLFIGWTDILMLGIFANEKDVGIYSVVFKVASLVTLVLMSVDAYSANRINGYWSKKELDSLENFSKTTTKIIFYVSLLIMLFILLFSRQILLFFGKEFISGFSVLLILCVGQFLSSCSGNPGLFLKMTDNQLFLQNLNLVALISNIILNYFFISFMGLNGAAIASMIVLISAKIIANLYIKKKFNFTLYLTFKRRYC